MLQDTLQKRKSQVILRRRRAYEIDKVTLRKIDALLENPRGKCLGVLGLGVSGQAMARFAAHRGARVMAYDDRQNIDLSALQDDSIQVRLGEHVSLSADVDVLAVSPGVHPSHVLVQKARATQVPVIGELELIGKLPAKVVAITGTNGKSTTTALVGALVQGTGSRVFVGGNIGKPVAEWVMTGGQADVAVLELSSFQLETAYRFTPDVAVILNVTPDHGDRYTAIEDYAAAKACLLRNLSPEQHAVFNADDEHVVAMAELSAANNWFWSMAKTKYNDRVSAGGGWINDVTGNGAWVDGDNLHFKGALTALGVMSLQHPRLLGAHNRSNAAAAVLAVVALMGVERIDRDQVLRAYLSFSGLPHRLEVVATVGGVTFVNDSKATNDDAAAMAIRAMVEPCVVLMGGKDKGGGYAAVRKAITDAGARIRQLIVYGAARDVLARSLGDFPRVTVCDDLAAAFSMACQRAVAGEVVLLAPACSSFDAFRNYEHRGQAFKDLVASYQQRAIL